MIYILLEHDFQWQGHCIIFWPDYELKWRSTEYCDSLFRQYNIIVKTLLNHTFLVSVTRITIGNSKVLWCRLKCPLLGKFVSVCKIMIWEIEYKFSKLTCSKYWLFQNARWEIAPMPEFFFLQFSKIIIWRTNLC